MTLADFWRAETLAYLDRVIHDLKLSSKPNAQATGANILMRHVRAAMKKMPTCSAPEATAAPAKAVGRVDRPVMKSSGYRPARKKR